jgi:hypothetical protein
VDDADAGHARAREPSPEQVREWEQANRKGHVAAAEHFRSLGYDVTAERVKQLFRYRDTRPLEETPTEDDDLGPDPSEMADVTDPTAVRDHLLAAIRRRVTYLADPRSIRGKNQMFVTASLKVLLEQLETLEVVTGARPDAGGVTDHQREARVQRALGLVAGDERDPDDEDDGEE